MSDKIYYVNLRLRGAILASGVAIELHDGIARGLAQRRFAVVPRRLTGERLNLPAELEVRGHPPARIEIYLARGEERPSIQLGCAGTLVADDLVELATLGLDGAPWTGRSLAGLIDFPGFNVPPGTRRGPLAAVRITPEYVRVAVGNERRVRASALDAAGRRVTGDVGFAWSIALPDSFEVRAEGARATVFARPELVASIGVTTSLAVRAELDGRSVEGSALVVVEESRPQPEATGGFGIPEPELVDEAGGGWRSRFGGQRKRDERDRTVVGAARGARLTGDIVGPALPPPPPGRAGRG